MDILLLALAAAGIFGLALLGASLWSVFVAWRKASKFGLSVTVMEARALTKFYELEDDFLKDCVAFQELDGSISIRDIVRHHMADGDTKALLSHWKQVKEAKVDLTFKSLVLYDLAGKGMDELIENINRDYELIIPEIVESGLTAYYYCKFKIAEESSGWINPDLNEFKKVIEEKISLALLTGDLSDFVGLSHFIKAEYLNEEFWKNLCHGEILEQQIRISKG